MGDDRRSGQDRRSNWTEALVRLRLPDSFLMELADHFVDVITDGQTDREAARQTLLDVLVLVRARVEGGSS